MRKFPIFLFPCSPLNRREVDPDFLEEYTTIKTLGGRVSLLNHDKLISNISSDDFYSFEELDGMIPSYLTLPNIEDPNDILTPVILRSWMLNAREYNKLHQSIVHLKYGLINDYTQYINCHHFPRAYGKIRKLSPKAKVLFSMDVEYLSSIMNDFPPPYIIKDYVKSEKHIPGLFKVEAGTSPEQLHTTLNRFKEERGKLFNEGIVLKSFVDLKKYDGKTNEWRLFVLNNSIISIGQNSNLDSASKPDVSFLRGVLHSMESNFFTIDIAEDSMGNWIVVECGDGQVSGLSSSKSEMLALYNALIMFEHF